MDNGKTEISLGGTDVQLALPQSFALLSDVVSAASRNQGRAFGAALGICWQGSGKPRTSLQGYSYDVMVYGGAVLDELAARGLKYNELQAAGMMAWSLCAAAILTESEVSDTEDFTGGAAASTG